MLNRLLLPCVLMSSFLLSAVSGAESRMLMLTQSAGYQHGSVTRGRDSLSPAEVAMIQLGQQTGLFSVDCSQDAAADFTRDNLKKYDIVMFYTSGPLPIAEEDLDDFFNTWLRQAGHGFIGVHSATDTLKEYQPYWDMVGGTFNGHPWGAGTTVTIRVHEPDHPLVSAFGSEFTIQDEIYQYKNWQPEKVRVLMSLDMTRCEPKRPWHVPVAWVKPWGEGRVFYTNLGHNIETWTNPAFLRSLAAGVRWIRGDVEGPAIPNPELSAAQEAEAKSAADPARDESSE